MRQRPLAEYHHPDLSNFVIHFVARTGRHVREVPDEILLASGFQRLLDILRERRIRPFPAFGQAAADTPVVCFTECTPGGVETLIAQGRYEPWGIAFKKDFIFRNGGGPAFYVRGDEWPLVTTNIERRA